MADNKRTADTSSVGTGSWREELLAKNPHLSEFLPFLDELNSESDRGMVLISCSYLDELLRRAIEAFLVDKKTATKLLSDFNAPLGTFSSRITAAKALGLIDGGEHDVIERMRKVRNEFAHSITVKFTDAKIEGLCSTFQFQLSSGKLPPMPARQRFSMIAVTTITRLMNRAAYAERRRLQTQTWPD